MNPLFVVILSQACFTIGDVLARANLRTSGFNVRAFLSLWFLGYCVVRTVATFAQLYVFATVELGRTMALFGATSIVLSNLLGFLLLGETLSLSGYLGTMLAVAAFLVIALVNR